MAADQLITLIRAVVSLRLGTSDDELIAALAALILTPPASRAVSRNPMTAVEARQRPQAIATPVPAVFEPAKPPLRPQRDRGGSSDTSRGSRKKDAGLIGRPSILRKVDERADLQTPRRSTGDASQTASRQVAEPSGPAAPLESLFPAGRVRGILRELATLRSASGPPDMDAAIALIARGMPIQRLPRRVVSVLGHSVQLLFDAGPAMLPFTRDKQQLAATTIRTFGRDRGRVADFMSTPLNRVRVQRQVRWDELRWPVRGSTIVVVTDLGIGSDETEAGHSREWNRFVEESDRRGLRSVVLIPYGPERWPQAADAFGTALTWDLETGVQDLHKRARSRQRVRPR